MPNRSNVDLNEKRMRGSLAVVKLGEAAALCRRSGVHIHNFKLSAEDRTLRQIAEEMAAVGAKKKTR
jgi:hypothetical protein